MAVAELKTVACEYWKQGLPIVLLNDNKQPLHEWKQWQTQKQTEDEFNSLPWDHAKKFAVVCGVQGSNGLFFCVIDTDNPAFDLGLLRTTQTERTPRRGYHFPYWSHGNARGQKLHDLKIELLGQGNLCIMYPSKGYTKVNDNLPTEIDDINVLFEDLVKRLGGNVKKPSIDIQKLLEGVKVGERDTSAIQIAVYYRKKRLDQQQVLEKLREWNRKNKQLLEDAELKKTVESAFKPEEPYNYRFADDKEKQGKKRKQYKDSGLCESGYFEAVYQGEKPSFLLKSGEDFRIVETVEVNGETFHPKEVKHIPYEPYAFYEGSVPNRDELFLKVYQEFRTFVDVEDIYRDVLSACVLLTYHQEKLQTVPYIFMYGDNESGKSTVLGLLKFLCYRPMYGVTVPSADLYGYLEDSDSIGTILEDEIQGINKDTDKIKIYKAGYKRGAVVPRTIITQHDRIIKYYGTFGFKSCASEQIIQVKGFNERFIFLAMVEGFPEKEWADLTKEDLKRLHNLRNTLLKWRLLAREWDLPEVQTSMKGRLKELWKPILQVTHGLTVHDGLCRFVEEQKNERLGTKQNTLEGHIVKVVTELFNEAKDSNPFISNQTIWSRLQEELDGKIDDKKPNVMDTSEFFNVTKNKVGYRLREILSGKPHIEREKDSDGNWISVRGFIFDLTKRGRVAKKYGYESVTKLQSLRSSSGVQTSESMESMEKIDGDNVEKEPHTHLELCKLRNERKRALLS